MLRTEELVMPSEKSSPPEVQALLTGLEFGESPRWHEGRLWTCNWGRQEVVAVNLAGRSETMFACRPAFHSVLTSCAMDACSWSQGERVCSCARSLMGIW